MDFCVWPLPSSLPYFLINFLGTKIFHKQSFHKFSSVPAIGFKHLVERSSRPEVSCKKGILRNFAKFIRKHLCQSLFSIKFQASFCNFFKKGL